MHTEVRWAVAVTVFLILAILLLAAIGYQAGLWEQSP